MNAIKNVIIICNQKFNLLAEIAPPVKPLQIVYTSTLIFPALIHLTQKIINDSGGLASRYGPIIVVTALTIGYIAQIKNIRLLRQWFWKAVFWSFAFISLTVFVYSIFILALGASKLAPIFLLISFVILTIPAQIQLFIYSKNDALWKKQP